MGDSVNTLNNLAADPEFLKLPDEEQKILIQKARGSQATSQPKPAFSLPAGVSMMGASNQGTNYDPAIDAARPILAGTAGHAAGAAVAGTGIGMGAAPAADVGTYTVVDSLLKYLKREKPESLGSSLVESGQEALTNKALSGLFNIVGKGAKAVLGSDIPDKGSILNFSPTTSQALKATGSEKLAVVAKSLEDLSLSAKEKALDRSAGAGFTQALKLAKENDFNFSRNPNTALDIIRQDSPTIPGDFQPFRPGKPFSLGVSEPQLNSFSAVDKVISDPKKIQDVLSTAQQNGVGVNLKKSLQGYQFMKMFQDASKKSVDVGGYVNNVSRVNAQGLEDAWLDDKMQDSLRELYNSKQRSDITQFISNVKNTQDKINSNPIARRFWMMHAGIGLATGLFTGSLVGGATGALTSGGVLIGAEGLGKLLTNPKTARLMVSLAGGEPLGVSEAYAGRQIVNALQGMTVAISNSDGSTTPVKIQGERMVPLQ